MTPTAPPQVASPASPKVGLTDLSTASKISDWTQRGAAVVAALQETADRTQADARKSLNATGASYQPFWISNTILVRNGSPAVADGLANLANVARLDAPKGYELPKPIDGTAEPAINAVEWGVAAIKADQVWSTFGVRGEGIVVANIDTGVDFDHPALVGQYRGNNGGGSFDHNYSWYDPSSVCGTPSLIPCDNHNHGTHTMGTMVGSDGANQIGVAPVTTPSRTPPVRSTAAARSLRSPAAVRPVGSSRTLPRPASTSTRP